MSFSRIDATWSNGFVSIALLVFCTIIEYFINGKRKEDTMKQVKSTNFKLMESIRPFLQTVWAIGTSITATGVLI